MAFGLYLVSGGRPPEQIDHRSLGAAASRDDAPCAGYFVQFRPFQRHSGHQRDPAPVGRTLLTASIRDRIYPYRTASPPWRQQGASRTETGFERRSPCSRMPGSALASHEPLMTVSLLKSLPSFGDGHLSDSPRLSDKVQPPTARWSSSVMPLDKPAGMASETSTHLLASRPESRCQGVFPAGVVSRRGAVRS